MSLSFDLPSGVEFREFKRSVTIRMVFYYRGVRCRENFCRIPLPGTTASSIREFEVAVKRNIKAAGNLLSRIRYDIDTHEFHYSNYFPGSDRGRQFGQYESPNKTIGFYLDKVLERQKSQIRPKSYEILKNIVNNQLKPEFGNILACDITAGMLRDWIFLRSSKKGNKRKTINNLIIPLKQALDDAMLDGVIKDNPARIINLDQFLTRDSKKSDFKVDPFTEEEIAILLDNMDGQVKNLYQFAFYTGLRTSELIGLKWEKVDFDNREVLIDQAMVYGHMDELKTASKGINARKVFLLDEALKALEAQKAYTYQEGNFVFHNPRTNIHWHNDTQLRKRAWLPAIGKSGLRYRNPYQTRHTYAHMMIRDNDNLWWIANQMGHTGIEMLNRHYGGWINETTEKYVPRRLASKPGD
ncbi:site-specific integrase [Kistimonas scapharcae]|uniref:Site-specific integrase n=1 Tax=Kistimonas scapharcae TaxID=1036133 RepID=A0ABP8V7C7_9GAMM